MTGLHRFRSMGCEIVLAGASYAEARAAEALFAERDRRFSRFRPDSELSVVNASPTEHVLVSQFFADTVAVALEAAAATDGLVDPTLGDAIEAAGYDRDFAQLDGGRMTRPRRAEGGRWREVELTGRLLSRPLGLKLDLNGVVKSLAVDDALALLGGPGFVSAGGDLATNEPLDVALPNGGAVRLVAGGLATSGSAARRWVCDGQEQHHLLDPATGRPARVPWTQVTVAAGSCLAADVCAKAAFLAGPDWLDERDLPGRFVGDEGVAVTRAWSAGVACT